MNDVSGKAVLTTDDVVLERGGKPFARLPDLRVAAGYCFVGPSIEFRVGFEIFSHASILILLCAQIVSLVAVHLIYCQY